MSHAGASRLPVADLERVLERACGVALSAGVRQAMLDGFHRAARELGHGSEPFLRRLLAEERRAVAALVENVVVGETYFYRHPEQLAAVTERLIEPQPPDRPLAIWSAGCATGEEPYTLAMLLQEAGRRDAGDRIVATDVSGRALEAARAGSYGEWSLRRLDPALRQRFFEGAGRRLSVTGTVRAPVEFHRHNLVRDLPPGSRFDLVICRNVLIYFTPATAEAVVERLVGAVRPGGWLLVGPVEVPLTAAFDVERVEVPGATLLRRGDGPPRRPAAPPGPAALRAERQAPGPLPPAGLAEPSSTSLLSAETVAVHPEDFERARAAARAGDVVAAERIAREAAERRLCPESYLLLAMAAEARGDDAAAVEAVRRALYLEPSLAQAHAALVPLFCRLGRAAEAARARRNALEALRGLDDDTVLRGVEPITAGALRLALATDGGPAAAPAAGRNP